MGFLLNLARVNFCASFHGLTPLASIIPSNKTVPHCSPVYFPRCTVPSAQSRLHNVATSRTRPRSAQLHLRGSRKISSGTHRRQTKTEDRRGETRCSTAAAAEQFWERAACTGIRGSRREKINSCYGEVGRTESWKNCSLQSFVSIVPVSGNATRTIAEIVRMRAHAWN